MAEALRKQPDVDVKLVEGANGELTVLMDGREVARKGESLPSVEDVVNAVRQVRQHAEARA
ncbi:MAG TPA: hypothetical protein VLM40_20765 [Gemmata sp.]|nr:hypothetical protein [Gemmata sp.]